MNDNEFLERIAGLWVELGGDSDGVCYTWTQLRDKVAEIESEEQ